MSLGNLSNNDNVPTSKLYEDKVYIYKALRLELYPNSLSNPRSTSTCSIHFFPNISSDYYWLIPIEIDIEYLLKICIYQKGFRRPIFFQNCSPLLFLPSLAFNWDPAEIRCRIFSSLKGYHFFPGPQTWNLLKIKGTGVIQSSRHFPIGFHLFLWTCPSLTPRDAGVRREGLGTQRKLTGLWTLEAGEGAELSRRQSSTPRNPQGCLTPALTKSGDSSNSF